MFVYTCRIRSRPLLPCLAAAAFSKEAWHIRPGRIANLTEVPGALLQYQSAAPNDTNGFPACSNEPSLKRIPARR